MPKRDRVETISGQLESIWANIDTLFAELDETGWQQKHGQDWVFADVPYHLAYFDRFMAWYAEAGTDLPVEEQLQLDSIAAMGRWNAEQFALRPAGQTPAESVAEMQAARNGLRALMAGLTDDELSRPAWMSLTVLRGWRTVEMVLSVCLMHTWSEFFQLRLLMGRATPEPDPAITHMVLDVLMLGMHGNLDHEAAAQQPLLVQYNITGAGGGRWTVSLTGEGARIVESNTAKPDLVFEQSVEMQVKTFYNMHDPALAIQQGAIRVQGMDQLATYAQLLPPPEPETLIAAVPEV